VDVGGRLRNQDSGIGSVVSVDERGAGDVSRDLGAWQHLNVLLCLNDVDDLVGQACSERHEGQKVILDSAEGNFDTRLKSYHLETCSQSDEALYLYEH
jgi:hypothetical protein